MDRIIRILVVDDFELWRRFVSSFLSTDSRFHVVGEASDGLDAVEKLVLLQPDIVILDVGLPMLNGIEAARRMCAICPNTKILLFTEESSVDVIRESLRSGAKGYVVKTDAIRDLLPALDAVIHGEVFVGTRFTHIQFIDTVEEDSHEISSVYASMS